MALLNYVVQVFALPKFSGRAGVFVDAAIGSSVEW